jgi:hypothetical protein
MTFRAPNEDKLADMFALRECGSICYVCGTKKWMIRDFKGPWLWDVDHTFQVQNTIREYLRHHEMPIDVTARLIAAVEKLARTDPRLCVASMQALKELSAHFGWAQGGRETFITSFRAATAESQRIVVANLTASLGADNLDVLYLECEIEHRDEVCPCCGDNPCSAESRDRA